jgi:hypothetical protein
MVTQEMIQPPIDGDCDIVTNVQFSSIKDSLENEIRKSSIISEYDEIHEIVVDDSQKDVDDNGTTVSQQLWNGEGADDNATTQQTIQAPGTTIYHYKSTEETYFQWDYRYHRKVKETNMINMLKKIETTLHNAHLEPYGKQRGVDTVRNNLLNLDVKEKFRLGRNKSLEKGKIIRKSGKNGLAPDYKVMHERMKRLLRPMYLLRSMLKVLYERHAIYASGYTVELSKLDEYCLGESFYGYKTHIRMDHHTAKLILRELWLHGWSGKFNKLQKEHNQYQERLRLKNYKPKLTDDD